MGNSITQHSLRFWICKILAKRWSLAGKYNYIISKYLEEGSTDVLTWSTDTSIRIKAGSITPFYGLDFNISNCSFTNRIQVSDVFSEGYDWRMTQNPTSLSSVLTYNTA